MRGNIVIAAAIAGAAFIIASIVFVFGLGRALERSADTIAESVRQHSAHVSRAGEQVGPPIAAALAQIDQTHAKHANSVLEAGRTMAQPVVTWKSPLPIVDEQPLRIQGTVGVEVGENKEAKKRFEK